MSVRPNSPLLASAAAASGASLGSTLSWRFLGLAAFLVSVPVFFQAPLVREWPWLSLAMTISWLGLGQFLYRRPATSAYGDLLVGFTWSWLAGSIYWGWFRWEPLIHLPIEAIGVPFALWAIAQSRYRIGALFYLGSLWGTAITDAYFYAMDLIPTWRQLMQVDIKEAAPLLTAALDHIQTYSGALWAGVLVLVLCGTGLLPLAWREVWQGDRPQLAWWAFMGAVLSTLVVDGLFWFAVRLA